MSDARREPGAVRGSPGARQPGDVPGRRVRLPDDQEPTDATSLLMPWLPNLPFRPAEGWLALACVVVIVTSLAWSIDDARWVLGAGELTDFLPLVGLAGILVGFGGPKLGWGRWTTHFIGVGFAAIVIPIIAGGIVLGDSVTGWGAAELTARYREAARVVYRVWIDLAIDGRPLTTQYGHYFIAFGTIVWATGQFAAYAVFGHHRALDAVVVTGLVLLANMALTQNDQLHLIVIFSIGALGLLARSHAYEERLTWLRRRIGDPATVASLYLRGSTAFIGGAVLGSLVLTTTASSAPLQGLWRDVPASLVEFSQWLQRYVPLGGDSRNPGIVTFGDEALITGSWNASDGVAFRAQLPAAETERFYWQAGVYSNFELTAWTVGTTRTITRAAGAALLTGTPDDVAGVAGVRQVEVVISPEAANLRTVVLSPLTIETIDRAATVKITGPGAYFASVKVDSTDRYEITALVPVIGNDEGATTANRLRVASREYPAEIERLYLAVPAGSIGPDASELLDSILERVPADNPYDIAATMETYLRSGRNFRYDTNVQDEAQGNCLGVSTVECFARIRAGYCQYYASTMAILLRELGIPTRLVQGFLPGDRDVSGLEVVRNAGAHAWVQVYFPGYGWVDFDPTGGNVAQRGPLPSGPPASPTPRPSFSFGTGGPLESDPEINPNPLGPDGSSGSTTSQPGPGPFIAIAVLLVVGALALGFAAWRRGPRAIHPDRAWGSIGRLAARFGFGPRPSQTVYEYAGALGDVLPTARPELRTVANAKVEIAYGRRELSTDRLRAVAEAHRRLRIRLLRLAFRRPRRPGRRGQG
ncbi:MAG: transglutaminase domain-containing protein [Chloroflexota bacterium]